MTKNTTASKIWTKTEIETLLTQNDQAIFRGVIAIFNKQTESEKKATDTIVKNGVGFSGGDGKVGTFHGKYLVSFGGKTAYAQGTILKYWKQISLKTGKMKIMKYSSQLTKIANKEI